VYPTSSPAESEIARTVDINFPPDGTWCAHVGHLTGDFLSLNRIEHKLRWKPCARASARTNTGPTACCTSLGFAVSRDWRLVSYALLVRGGSLREPKIGLSGKSDSSGKLIAALGLCGDPKITEKTVGKCSSSSDPCSRSDTLSKLNDLTS
jgi:hypothetical protein